MNEVVAPYFVVLLRYITGDTEQYHKKRQFDMIWYDMI
jgi:hypothetical protein